MASACVIESGTWAGNLPSIVLSCQVGNTSPRVWLRKKLRLLAGGKKNAGKQHNCLAPWRRHSTGFGDFQSTVCTGRQDHGTARFRGPAGWKACALPFWLAASRFPTLALL